MKLLGSSFQTIYTARRASQLATRYNPACSVSRASVSLHSNVLGTLRTSHQCPTASHLSRPRLGFPTPASVRPTGRWRTRHYNDHSQAYAHYQQEAQKNTNFIWGIIAANAAIFAAWQYSMPRSADRVVSTPSGWQMANSSQAPHVYNTLKRYYLLRASDWKNGNYLSSLGSAFSHTNLMHFLGNGIAMYAFGSILSSIPGVRVGHLASLVFGSAFLGSAGFVMFESQRPAAVRGPEKAALGASGVVMGLGAAAFALVPKERLLIYGILPVPLWVILPTYFLIDAYKLDDSSSRTAHSGHLGGAAFGLIYTALKLRRLGGIFGR